MFCIYRKNNWCNWKEIGERTTRCSIILCSFDESMFTFGHYSASHVLRCSGICYVLTFTTLNTRDILDSTKNKKTWSGGVEFDETYCSIIEH